MNVSFCRRAAKNDVWLMPDRVIQMVLAFPAKDGVNGRVYHSGDTQELYEKVRRLLDDTAAQERLGSAAYQTISELWNAETAAERLLQLSQALLDGQDTHKLFADGPCSPAHPLREDWYRK